jgi:hypothetical protein
MCKKTNVQKRTTARTSYIWNKNIKLSSSKLKKLTAYGRKRDPRETNKMFMVLWSSNRENQKET